MKNLTLIIFIALFSLIQCSPIESKQKKHPGCLIWVGTYIFFKFHGIVQCTYILLGIISWLLFYLIWENCVLHWDFDLKFWIVDVYTHITHKKYHTKQLLFFQKCRKLYKLLLKTIYIFPVVCSWLSSGKNVWRGPVQYLPLGWVTLIT